MGFGVFHEHQLPRPLGGGDRRASGVEGDFTVVARLGEMSGEPSPC